MTTEAESSLLLLISSLVFFVMAPSIGMIGATITHGFIERRDARRRTYQQQTYQQQTYQQQEDDALDPEIRDIQAINPIRSGPLEDRNPMARSRFPFAEFEKHLMESDKMTIGDPIDENETILSTASANYSTHKMLIEMLKDFVSGIENKEVTSLEAVAEGLRIAQSFKPIDHPKFIATFDPSLLGKGKAFTDKVPDCNGASKPIPRMRPWTPEDIKP